MFKRHCSNGNADLSIFKHFHMITQTLGSRLETIKWQAGCYKFLEVTEYSITW